MLAVHCATFCVQDCERSVSVCRKKFEVVLGALGQYETEAANQLMQEALEAMDTMNNAINLQNEVCWHCRWCLMSQKAILNSQGLPHL